MRRRSPFLLVTPAPPAQGAHASSGLPALVLFFLAQLFVCLISSAEASVPRQYAPEEPAETESAFPNGLPGGSVALSEEEARFVRDKRTVRMCVDPNWMPLERITPAGRHEGMAADYLALMSWRVGLRLELVATRDWGETLDNARNGRCDIISAADSSAPRREYLSFTRPYMSFPYVIATRSEQMFVENFSSLAGRKIGVVKEYAAGDLLRSAYPGITLVEVENVGDGLRRVAAGELFGFVDTVATISFAIRQENLLDLKIAGRLDESLNLSVAVAKSQPMLLSVFEKAAASLSQDDRNAIYRHWIAIKFEQGFDNRRFWRYLACAAVVIAAVFYWNRKLARLNREIRRANAALSAKGRELEQLSITDHLTGLANRRKLEELLEREILRASRYFRPFVVIMLDIDHFKQINDTHGHVAGDIVLKALGETLHRCLRSTDILGRWGGEEFLAICPETNIEGGNALAEKLRAEVEGLAIAGGLNITISLGVAAYAIGDTMLDLVGRADRALYEAKNAGRNRVAAG